MIVTIPNPSDINNIIFPFQMQNPTDDVSPSIVQPTTPPSSLAGTPPPHTNSSDTALFRVPEHLYALDTSDDEITIRSLAPTHQLLIDSGVTYGLGDVVIASERLWVLSLIHPIMSSKVVPSMYRSKMSK